MPGIKASFRQVGKGESSGLELFELVLPRGQHSQMTSYDAGAEFVVYLHRNDAAELVIALTKALDDRWSVEHGSEARRS